MKIPPHRDYIFEGKASSARFLPVVDVTADFAPFPPGLPPFSLAALPVMEMCDCDCFILSKEAYSFKILQETHSLEGRNLEGRSLEGSHLRMKTKRTKSHL